MLPSFNCGFTAVGQDGVILDPEQGAQTIPENMVTLSPHPEQGAQTIPENMVTLSPPRVSGLAEERAAPRACIMPGRRSPGVATRKRRET